MTDSERSLILALRSRGTGYKQIAAALGLPLSTVKAFCRRNTIEENENARKCDMCGEVFEFSPKRPTRRFCCSSCRMKWWNVHRDQLKKKAFYLLQDDVSCGDKSQTHTVREWLEGFDIAVEDEAFIAWNEALAMFSPRIKELETKLRPISKALLWESMKVGLYLNYRTDQEFLPQLRENIKGFKDLLDRTDEALAEEANGEEA